MRTQRSFEEEQLRELRKIYRQLNPLPALLRFFFWVCLVLFTVFGLFAVMTLPFIRH